MPILGVIASARLGKPVVTGGTLTSDATFFYRTFTGNGTLGVTGLEITADILVIAGGGSGGGAGAGGGGGGPSKSLGRVAPATNLRGRGMCTSFTSA